MNQTSQTDTNRGGSHRHVSLAPPSRCLTDRQLLLSSTKPHASILKEHRCDVYRRHLTDMSFWTRPREERAEMSRDVSPPSGAHKHCASSVAVSELRGGRDHEEHTFRSSSEQSLSGSIPEFEPPNLPLRQSLTSTVLNPTYTPQPGHLKSGQKEGRGWGRSEGDLTSPHKANYWACAIPKDLPQSPDRHSAGWDPNKEYQALLDYTYPLRTNPLTCDSAERHKHSLLQADMQDSGIDLENVCSWTSLSGLDVSVSSTEQTEERSRLDRSFTELQGEEPLLLTDPATLYLNNVDSSKSGSDHHLQRHEWPCSTSTALTRSSGILHQPVCACMEEDEEVRRLPEQLSELQLLSTQVFCSHLEQLLQYLYAASEKIQLLAQPAVDIARLKLSLDEYQREVRNHLPLTSCVMHSGQLLLRSINSMSPC
ncbi:hypothetical protein JOB18_048138 [Solea senegalensis]|uniref:Centrosomal protein 68 n=1 Tax=Solea senegalensis TaxID=28829 RepID=A0AAV6QLN8_SOLSE|nr:hypothetical protein JOB18_048138 [Solea senegalensis]